jgi:Sporulation and spore germination
MVGIKSRVLIIVLLLGVIPAGLTGCRSPVVPPSPSPTVATPSPTAPQTTVTIYKANDQCDQYEPSPVQVPADSALEAAVGEVIKAQSNEGFAIAGYRVRVDQGVATVDFRVAPDSPRQIASLSSCEQFVLFGGISETLTKNPQFQVQEVRFSDRGEEIAF